MTMTWDADYTFTGCGLRRRRQVALRALAHSRVDGRRLRGRRVGGGRARAGDVPTSVFRRRATDEGGEVKLDGARAARRPDEAAEPDFSALADGQRSGRRLLRRRGSGRRGARRRRRGEAG